MMKTFKWTEEQKKALRGSILKWKKIANGTGINNGPRDCPCCVIWARKNAANNYVVNCKGCPIRQFTGKKECYDTPYYTEEGLTLPQNPSKQSTMAELNFLRAVYLAGGGK